MKSRSGREIVGYVVRSGRIPGAGRYAWARGTWTDKATASRWIAMDPEGARTRAKNVNGRVVTLVRREPKAANPSESPKPSPGLDEAAQAAFDVWYRDAPPHMAPGSAPLLAGHQAVRWRAVAEAVRDAWGLRCATGALGERDEARAQRDSAIAEGIQLRGEAIELRSRLENAQAALRGKT